MISDIFTVYSSYKRKLKFLVVKNQMFNNTLPKNCNESHILWINFSIEKDQQISFPDALIPTKYGNYVQNILIVTII